MHRNSCEAEPFEPASRLVMRFVLLALPSSLSDLGALARVDLDGLECVVPRVALKRQRTAFAGAKPSQAEMLFPSSTSGDSTCATYEFVILMQINYWATTKQY